MNLLTFLGAGKYSKTTYTFNKQTHATKYAPAATAHFFRPQKTLIVVTNKAEAMHFESLADEIAAVTTPVAIPIPDGHSEAELWQIFNALTQHVAEGDELVVDITNGFRSLPFLSFLAIAFLRLARQVKVRRVLYGAWEARNEENNETPVFDLTPFVALLDWTIAADRFIRFGDSGDLATLLRAEIPPGKLMGVDLQARELGNALKSAATTMDAVSLALRLTRPLETMTAGVELQNRLTKVNSLIVENIPPFSLLTKQIQQAYRPLSLSEPLNKENWRVNLQIQLDLVGWYLEKGQIVQAVTLSREWLVSLLAYHFKADSMTAYKTVRQPIEFALNNEAERLRREERPLLQTIYEADFQKLSNAKEIGKLWGDLANLRNDIAHVGMKTTPRSAARLRKNAQTIYPELEDLADRIINQ